MKSEIFVVNAVKSSEKALTAVQEHIEALDLDRLMKALQSPERVRQEARRLGQKENELFIFLEKYIRDVFERRPRARLSHEHLSALLVNDVQRHLAKVLGCPPGEVLQTLFAVSALQDTLEYLDRGASGLPANVSVLLNEILKSHHAQRLQNNYGVSANNWETILKSEEWLESDAAEKLLQSDIGIAASNPYEILASLIDQYKATQDAEADQDATQEGHIRALGLLDIRRRLSSITDNLYGQSIETAEHLPKSPVMRFFVSLIYLYELGYVAKGIDEFISTSSKLKELLKTKDIDAITIAEDQVDRIKPLVFHKGQTYQVSGNELGNFEIHCTVDGKDQTILMVTAAPGWLCDQLQKDIPRLTPVTLRGEGSTVSERLLNTSFPLEPEGITRLREAVRNLGPAFTQAVVLASDGKIAGIQNVWGEPIPHRLPFDELPVTGDPAYVTDIETHIARLKSQYGYTDDVVRRGIPQADAEPQAGES